MSRSEACATVVVKHYESSDGRARPSPALSLRKSVSEDRS
jgi:hypothetical protein